MEQGVITMNLMRNRLVCLRNNFHIRLLQQPPRVGGSADALALNNVFAIITSFNKIKMNGVWISAPSKCAWSIGYE